MEEIIKMILTNPDNAILVFIGLVLKDLWCLLKFILKNITNKINGLILEYKQKKDNKKLVLKPIIEMKLLIILEKLKNI